jgi:hypothetical protein
MQWSLPVATRALRLAATVWLITCAAKLTFIVLCAFGFRWGVCQFVQLAKQSGFVEFTQFQYVVPLSNDRKLVAQVLRLQLHIIL